MYTKVNGKIVFKDYELLLEAFETKVCMKIIHYKWDKIFVQDPSKLRENSAKKRRKSISK